MKEENTGGMMESLSHLMRAGYDGAHQRTLNRLKVYIGKERINVDRRMWGQTERW